MLFAPRARANAWEDAADLSAALGLTLDEWQETVLRAALGERPDGRWAAHQVGLSAPRQNGKSQLIVARALAGALMFGESKIIISAHQQGTARETFNKFVDQIEANPGLERRLKGGSVRTGVINALNRETIKFANGAVIEFKARQGNTGRGFSCDLLFLDEAQILSSRAWATINSTMSARPNPQVWLLGTPPTPDDDGEVFTRIRQSALSKAATSLAWAEWAAAPEDDPALEETRAKANPAWYTRINHEVVQGEFDTYSPEQFALERLGIWPADAGMGLPPEIDPAAWDALRIDAAPDGGHVAFGVKFAPGGKRVTLAAALAVDDEPTFVEIVGPPGDASMLDRLVDWLAERWRDCDSIVIDGKDGRAQLLMVRLVEAGVRARVISMPSWPEIVTANAAFVEAVEKGAVSHAGQPGLRASIAGAAREERGKTGGWGFQPNGPDVDVTPTEAVALAMSGLKQGKRRARGGGNRSGKAVSA